jgi:hypothetical protein
MAEAATPGDFTAADTVAALMAAVAGMEAATAVAATVVAAMEATGNPGSLI